jgi:hypothetical protein
VIEKIKKKARVLVVFWSIICLAFITVLGCAYVPNHLNILIKKITTKGYK